MSAADQLLVVIDPVARRIDGESVRIAKDVLCAGAQAKICWPEGVEEFSRALARRGARRLVVVGDDRALLRAVTLLQRERERDVCGPALAVVPVGTAPLVELARSLGVPTGAVAAARAVLDGSPHRLDLLVDDSGGVVLGDLCIPAAPPAVRAAVPTVWDTCRSLVRTLVRAPVPAAVAHRLRVEADGVLLSDLDRPVAGVSVGSGDGVAHVVVSRGVGVPGVRVRAREVTVSGDGFRYRAGQVVAGPVRTRTWTAGTWTLTLPSPTPPVA
ncbi:diacylglycerol kinase family protein [Streptomyces sp. BPTC-684]|uniref:diacylglycerol kinase family protein n=1 Tax=Streptomyces sp. BPTC-684 TaxID=3043734 RepID=UPI0024B13AA5|nr:diacylglycerol kinase family protein [Streptomyces sp. BPTC-684]WHM37951.1 diacylglycerol kinase family protein [Streptomyces sp. BPTC-684]